jgi:peptide maturation system protein (TIGR04066 family)
VKKNAVIYPYDNTLSYFFRHNDLFKKYNIVGAVSPFGWGYTGKDAGTIDGGSNVGIIVKDKFSDLDDTYDTVIITDTHLSIDFDSILYRNIEELVTKGKNLLLYRELDTKKLEKISLICKNKGVSLRIPNETIFNRIDTKEIVDINTPVVFILGLSQRTQKFEIQLSIREELIKSGYKVGQIGTKNHCDLFGFSSFPKFMFDESINESEKVLMFNRLVKRLELKEKPDIIIIGIPGGILPINKYFTNGFGILAYLISQAVKPDITVFTTLYKNYYLKHFEDINNLCIYRFGFSIDCFNLSNAELDIQELKQYKRELYTIIDSEFIDIQKNKYKGLGKRVFNILNPNDRAKMADYIVEALSGEKYIEEVL